MNTRFLTILVTLAFLGFSVSVLAGKKCDEDPNHRSCGGPSGKYTAALKGDFAFAPVVVTPGKKGGSLLNDVKITMDRPDDGGYGAWDGVFDSCVPSDVLSPTIDSVESNNWSIVNSGGNNIGTLGSLVVVRFHDISNDVVDDAGNTIRVTDIDFNLAGTLDYAGQFLPEPGWTHCLTLTRANIFGEGGYHGLSCKSGSNPLVGDSVTLEICHEDPFGKCTSFGSNCL